jgi:hypothetical protein
MRAVGHDTQPAVDAVRCSALGDLSHQRIPGHVVGRLQLLIGEVLCGPSEPASHKVSHWCLQLRVVRPRELLRPITMHILHPAHCVSFHALAVSRGQSRTHPNLRDKWIGAMRSERPVCGIKCRVVAHNCLTEFTSAARHPSTLASRLTTRIGGLTGLRGVSLQREPRGRGPESGDRQRSILGCRGGGQSAGEMPGTALLRGCGKPPGGPNLGPTLVPFLLLGTRGAVRGCSVTCPTKPAKRLQSVCLFGSVRTRLRGCKLRPLSP